MGLTVNEIHQELRQGKTVHADLPETRQKDMTLSMLALEAGVGYEQMAEGLLTPAESDKGRGLDEEV